MWKITEFDVRVLLVKQLLYSISDNKRNVSAQQLIIFTPDGVAKNSFLWIWIFSKLKGKSNSSAFYSKMNKHIYRLDFIFEIKKAHLVENEQKLYTDVLLSA